jgi:hypothetical protein
MVRVLPGTPKFWKVIDYFWLGFASLGLLRAVPRYSLEPARELADAAWVRAILLTLR